MNMISTGAFQTEMAASDKQDSLVKKLVDAGVVKTRDGQEITATKAAEIPEPPKSPNF